MKITTLIEEESRRFYSAYDVKPDYVFIGNQQAAEIDALVSDLRNLGLLRASDPIPRAKFLGMAVFRVDAANHLSFGVAQPSPCG